MPGKSSRRNRQNGNSSLSHSASCNGQAKDEKQIIQSAKDHDKDEIFKLRELNQRLIQVIDNLRQESEACLLQKLPEIESRLHILQAVSTNFETSMDNQLMQEVKFGEELSNHVMEVDREFRQQLAKRDQEHEAEICEAWQQLQEAEERFKREISEKEEDCRTAISDKQTLESSVLQLTDKIKVMSAVLEEARIAWKLEKNGLFSQIVAAQKQTAEMAKCSLTAEQAWNAEKENLLASLSSTYQQKIEDISTQKQRVFLEKIELESQLNDSKARTQELLENFEEERNLWNFEEQNLQGNVAELQIEIDSMVSERELLCHQNRELNTEAEFFKTQLSESIARLGQMEDERVQNERVLQQCRAENIDLQSRKYLWETEKKNLQCNVAELQTKIDSMASESGLLYQKNRELSTEAESLKAQLNEYKARLSQIEDEKVQSERVLQQCRAENIDLQAALNDSKGRTQDLLRKNEEGMHLWDAEKSNLEGTVAELKTKQEWMAREMASLAQNNRELTVEAEYIKYQVNTLKSELNESKKRTEELLQKSEVDQHLRDEEKGTLEGTLAELQTKHDDLVSQLYRSKALEEELLSTISSLKEMKVSTSKTEAEISNLRSQLFAVVEEKERQLSDVQKQLSAMAEEKKIMLAFLQDELSSISARKEILEEENRSLETELDRKTLVLEEEKVTFEDRVREFQTTFNSLNNEIESTRAIAEEKERQLIDLQNRHSDIVEAKKTLEKKNDYLLAEFNICRMVSEENARLQNRVNQLERTHVSLSRYIDCKNIRLRQFKSERQPLQAKRPVRVNGKLNGLLGNGKVNSLLGKQKQE